MMNRLFVLCFVGACTSASSTGITEVSCPEGSTLTYASFGSALLADHCLTCHASKERPVLSTQAQIQANRANILQEAVYTTAMPEEADLALAEREMLGEWLACGAP